MKNLHMNSPISFWVLKGVSNVPIDPRSIDKASVIFVPNLNANIPPII
jgi:hypothetical protein